MHKNGIFVNFFNNFILAKKNTHKGYLADVFTINNRVAVGVNLRIPPNQILVAVTIQKIMLTVGLVDNFKFVHFFYFLSLFFYLYYTTFGVQ